MTCRDCCAELMNRYVALRGMIKHNELGRAYIEFCLMQGFLSGQSAFQCQDCLGDFKDAVRYAYAAWQDDDSAATKEHLDSMYAEMETVTMGRAV